MCKFSIFKKRGTTPKTARKLYSDFRQKFTPNQIADSVELTVLCQYLANVDKTSINGAILYPAFPFADLLKKHMGYQPEGSGR